MPTCTPSSQRDATFEGDATPLHASPSSGVLAPIGRSLLSLTLPARSHRTGHTRAIARHNIRELELALARVFVHFRPAVEIVHQYQVGLHCFLHCWRRLLYPGHLQSRMAPCAASAVQVHRWSVPHACGSVEVCTGTALRTHQGTAALASSCHAPGPPHRPHPPRCIAQASLARGTARAANPSICERGARHPSGPPCLAQLPPYELAGLEAQQPEVQLLPAHGEGGALPPALACSN